MLLPAIQYGDWKDVKVRMRAVVRRIRRGEDVVDVMSEGGMLDTETTDGLLIVGGRARTGWTNFHCHMPWSMLADRVFDIRVEHDFALEAKIFEASLRVPWGVLGYLAYDNRIWFGSKKDWYEPFLNAVINTWDEIDSVGARYYVATSVERMWTVPNSLHLVLGQLGVSRERLMAPLPRGGPAALLKYIRLPT